MTHTSILESSLTILAAMAFAATTVVQGSQENNSSGWLTIEERRSAATSYRAWQVTVGEHSWLNCRERPGIDKPVVRELPGLIVVDAVLERPSSGKSVVELSPWEKAKLNNQVESDPDGRLWMLVNPRGGNGHDLCWVVADDRYLQPVTQYIYYAHLGDLEGDLSCYRYARAENHAYLRTSKLFVYICRRDSDLYCLIYDLKQPGTDGHPKVKLRRDMDEALVVNRMTFIGGAYRYEIQTPFEDATLQRLSVYDGSTLLQRDDILRYVEFF